MYFVCGVACNLGFDEFAVGVYLVPFNLGYDVLRRCDVDLMTYLTVT